MKSEITKSFRHGFILTEQELRRIYDLLVQQMERIAPKETIKSVFELKFKNGVIANPSSLDDIFLQENIGSSLIYRLSITLSVDIPDKPNISLSFANVIQEDAGDSGSNPIEYKIQSNDRDWVFVTSSMLDERVGRLRRFSVRQLSGRRYRNALFSIVMLSVVLAFVYFFAFTVPNQSAAIDRVEADWKSGKIKDPIEAMIALQRSQIVARDPSEVVFPMGAVMFLMVFVLFIMPMVFPPIINYLIPPYNFVWGDYVKIFESRQTFGKFVLFGLIIAIVVSVIANFISSQIGIGR